MRVQIIGAGLGGLSAALTLAKKGIPSNLISNQSSERAQSVMAAGGINAALNNMGENDTWTEHMNDTLKSGCGLADEAAVKNLTMNAPEIVRGLMKLGVPFNLKDGQILQRSFGGQKKKRTAYAKSSTGKMIMSALIDECRKYEAQGLIRRYDHHNFVDIISDNGICQGVIIEDVFDETRIGNSEGKNIQQQRLFGPVIIACGGMNGLFPAQCTGSTLNTSDVVARLFYDGVKLSNLEMIQYHPTTIAIAGKRCLVSEAARGEGGRLYVERNGEPWYFMEEKYPELGNLMPRDVVSCEMWNIVSRNDCDNQVYLDMRGISDETFDNKLSDLEQEINTYLGIDTRREPIPVSPGIHYFMGGIDVDIKHQTNVQNLYAVGECCSQYHGANRLGGNSMLGALYGGKVASDSIAEFWDDSRDNQCDEELTEAIYEPMVSSNAERLVGEILSSSMGIVRNGESLRKAIDSLYEAYKSLGSDSDKRRVSLAKALAMSAYERKESRGAHYRSDFSQKDEVASKTIAVYNGEVSVYVEE